MPVDLASSPPRLMQEGADQMIVALRRRLRAGRKLTFKAWMKDVKDLLDLLD